MKISSDNQISQGDVEKSKGEVPNDGLLNEKSLLIPPELEFLKESQKKMDDLTESDWENLSHYRKIYNREQQAQQALSMLDVQKDAPSYGFRINNYRHCLQSATMVYRDGGDDEAVVVALFHDLGFSVCPDNHGEFSAALLVNYISERNYWMLCHHAIFLNFHAKTHPDVDYNAREKYRGHPHFKYTSEWVARYDQTSIQTQYETAPLNFFKPMVYRFFTRPSKGVELNLIK